MSRQGAFLTTRIIRRIRSLVPETPPSLEFPAEKWDEEYRSGNWDYLGGVQEVPRYSVVAGYVGYFNDRSRILEIGCGTAILLRYIRHLDFTHYRGVDISGAAIEIASKLVDDRINFAVSCGSSYNDGSQYDIVVMNEALYYFDDCIKVLEHYRAQLRPNGRIIISMVVGPQSIRHWKAIEARYELEGGVRITGRSGHVWTCNVLAPFPSSGSGR